MISDIHIRFSKSIKPHVQVGGGIKMYSTQRNRYPETGCNGAPSLSIKTDFHVNFTETFSDGIRVFMNVNRRTLPHGTASSTIIDAWSRDTSNSIRIQKMSGK